MDDAVRYSSKKRAGPSSAPTMRITDFIAVGWRSFSSFVAIINMGNEFQEISGVSSLVPRLRLGTRGRESESRRGMTLMEVSLVLVLIVVIASFCWPSINKAFSIQRLKKSADIVRTQWCKARVKAMSNDRIVLFRYEMGGNRFRIEQLADVTSYENAYDGMTPDAEAFYDDLPANDPTMNSAAGGSPNTDYPSGNRDQSLPQGIVFRGCEIENDSRAMTAGQGTDPLSDAGQISNPLSEVNWSEPIYFYPDGTASNARLQICNDRNAAIELALRGMTGVVKIGEIIPVEGVSP